MQSGSKLNPERLFEFVSPFISMLVTRAGQNNRIEFALMSVCSKICPFQSYFSHLFSNKGWNLRRHRAPLVPTDFTETWWGSTPTSVLLFSDLQGKCMFSLTCMSRTLSITNAMKRSHPNCCQLSLTCQGFVPHVYHEQHGDKIRHCVYEVHRAGPGTGFTL